MVIVLLLATKEQISNKNQAHMSQLLMYLYSGYSQQFQ